MNPDRLPDPAKKNYFATVREEFSENTSGVEPVGTKVLVLTDSIATHIFEGKFQLTTDVVERMTLAITTGVIAAVGGSAFSDWPHSERKWPGIVPKVGDRVHLAKYAGIIIEGKDLKRYRLIQDIDIAGLEHGEHKPQLFALPKLEGVN